MRDRWRPASPCPPLAGPRCQVPCYCWHLAHSLVVLPLDDYPVAGLLTLSSATGPASNRRLAPRVLGAQPRGDHLEFLAFQDGAFAPDALFGDVEHTVQPHPARPCFVVPAAAADADPIRLVAMLLAGQHQPEQGVSIAADYQHRPVLAPRRIVL